MAVQRKETVVGSPSASQTRSGGTPGKRPNSNPVGNVGKGAAKIGGAIGNLLSGVYGQATGRPQPSVPANAGIGKRQPAKTQGGSAGRRETITPQYQALLNMQGRIPDANGSYARSRPPMAQGNPGQGQGGWVGDVYTYPDGVYSNSDLQQSDSRANGGGGVFGGGSNPVTGEMSANDPYIQWYLQTFGTLPPEYGG